MVRHESALHLTMTMCRALGSEIEISVGRSEFGLVPAAPPCWRYQANAA